MRIRGRRRRINGEQGSEAQPGRPARRRGRGVRGDLDGAGQAVMPAVRLEEGIAGNERPRDQMRREPTLAVAGRHAQHGGIDAGPERRGDESPLKRPEGYSHCATICSTNPVTAKPSPNHAPRRATRLFLLVLISSVTVGPSGQSPARIHMPPMAPYLNTSAIPTMSMNSPGKPRSRVYAPARIGRYSWSESLHGKSPRPDTGRASAAGQQTGP